MDDAILDEQVQHAAFIKAAQYIVRLTGQPEVHGEVTAVLVNFFKADWVAFAYRSSANTLVLRYCTVPDPAFQARLLAAGREGLESVLDSGFLAMPLLALPESYRAVFLPLRVERQSTEVLLIGYRTVAALPKLLLEHLLALSGLAETAMERLASERELSRHRDHLEELVRARTAEIAVKNAKLAEEIVARQAAEESLRAAMHRIQTLNGALEQHAHELELTSEALRVTNEELQFANEKLRIANDGLETSLTQEKTTRVALEASNKELEAFAYTVAHDLRAPLNLIQQFASIVLTDCGPQVDDAGQHLMHLILENAVAVDRLAEGLLSLSRLSRQAPSMRTVSMQDLVQQVLADLAGIREGRQVEMQVGTLPCVQGDPVLLKQVWFNLISNALKFTRPRQVAHIVIGAEQGSGETIFWVKDNGTGFDMTQAERLFRAFQRLHHAEDFEGNGLGLAIVERIVRQHGGRVWAEAEVDRGATFYFALG